MFNQWQKCIVKIMAFFSPILRSHSNTVEAFLEQSMHRQIVWNLILGIHGIQVRLCIARRGCGSSADFADLTNLYALWPPVTTSLLLTDFFLNQESCQLTDPQYSPIQQNIYLSVCL